MLRVRVSSNWSIESILGNYAVVSTDLLTLGNADETKSIAIEFNMHDEPSGSSEGFYIQVRGVKFVELFSVELLSFYLVARGSQIPDS